MNAQLLSLKKHLPYWTLAILLLSFPFSIQAENFLEDHLHQLTEDHSQPGTQRLEGPWVPTGATLKPISAACDPRSFEDHYLNYLGDPRLRISLIQNYFDRCGETLAQQTTVPFQNMQKQNLVEYNYKLNPLIKPIQIQLSGDNTVFGYLALQGGSKSKRPLIVFKCGIFCSGFSNGIQSTLLMHLLDESPFHILFLESNSASENSARNKRIEWGGFNEGQELFEIGFWLRFYANFRSRISSLHLMGVDMGGHSALYAAQYNDYNPISDDMKVFNSVLAYCPIVRLEPSLRSLYDLSPKGQLAHDITWEKFSRLSSQIEDLKQITRDENISIEKLPDLIAELSTRSLSRQNSSQYLLPFRHQGVHDAKTFWQRNDFVLHSDGIKTPTLVLASENDPLFAFHSNVEPLQNKHSNPLKGRLQVVSLKTGSHCSASTAYGWQALSATLRGYFLSNSYDYWIKREKRILRPKLPTLSLSGLDLHASQEWTIKAHETTAQLNFKIFRGNKSSCANFKIYQAPEACFEQISHSVPLSEIGINKSAADKTSAEILSRWLNSRLRVKGPSALLIESQDAPDHLDEIID